MGTGERETRRLETTINSGELVVSFSTNSPKFL